jgi:hypothetical protein
VKRLLLASLILAGTCQAGVVLQISPASQAVALGSQLSLAVDISGLGGGVALGVYDIDLAFDPTVLSYNSILFGTQLDLFGLGDIQSATPGSGLVNLFELSLESASDLNSLQASAFTLAILTFDTLAPAANSPVTLSVNALGDGSGNSIAAALDNGAVSVTSATTTPEPGSASLLLTMLPVLLLLRTKSPHRS